MTTAVQQGHRVGVLLIDEKQPAPDGNQAMRPANRKQLLVLQHAQGLGLPVIGIELNLELNHDARAHGVNTRRAFLPYIHQILNKSCFNAFDDPSYPSLEYMLNRSGLLPGSRLVIMGMMSNMCVRLTAVGGRDKPNAPHKDGATQRGYHVLTSQKALEGSQATWFNQPGVSSYTSV